MDSAVCPVTMWSLFLYKLFPTAFLLVCFSSCAVAVSENPSSKHQLSKLSNHPLRPTCVIRTLPNSTDDTPVVLNAFKECGQGGNIVFLNQTYHINSVMNTTDLKDCDIDLYGTMLVSIPSSNLLILLNADILS